MFALLDPIILIIVHCNNTVILQYLLTGTMSFHTFYLSVLKMVCFSQFLLV